MTNNPKLAQDGFTNANLLEALARADGFSIANTRNALGDKSLPDREKSFSVANQIAALSKPAGGPLPQPQPTSPSVPSALVSSDIPGKTG
jgi:hypothetical protein